MRRCSAAVIVLIAVLAGAVTPTPASARTLEIRGYDVELLVRRDGTVLVTERITVHFEGSWNGIYRTIPVAYDQGVPGIEGSTRGLSYTLRLALQSATDDRGNELEVDSERQGGNRRFQIWVPGANDATRTITLVYVVENGLRFFEQHDELYWNVTGNDWTVPVGTASAQVILPPEVTNVRATAFTGAYGATQQDAAVEIAGNGIAVRTTEPLAFREGLSVVVGWDPGVVHRPTEAERAFALLVANGILVVPLLVLMLMHWWWRRHGRDPQSLSIAPRYEPPPDLTPGEIGVIVDDRADMRDVTATLVDLAVRGYIVIEDQQDEKLFGLVKSQDYVFIRARDAAGWADLQAHEVALLNALFDNGSAERVEMTELKNSFYKDLPGIREQLTEALVEHGVYVKHPTKVRVKYLLLAVAATVSVAFGGSAFLAALGYSPLPAIVAGILTGVILTIYGVLMPARTVRGARLREEVLGFEEFLSRVEKDRFERVVRTPELFERYLPHAMALGVEESWARAFDDVYREPPQWYRSHHRGPFLAHMFVSDLSGMATQTSTAMASSPRSSSSSSGFSGGGFSGGGFGGGGGGGF